MTDGPTPLPTTLPALADRAAADAATLDAELAEIDMLVAQAQSEATRHETRRQQTAEKLAAATTRGDTADLATINANLVTLTRRAAVMEAQADILKGKQRALQRYRESAAAYAEALGSLARGLPAGDGAIEGGARTPDPAVADTRAILSAQEDLRREIARAMHDGPAQSLTNIVLQAQIVDRLLGHDDDLARGELRLLMDMVQQTLEATKSFIFDVRPMVLDDLGLVPTLRRAARERARRSQVPVAFTSTGQDQRLGPEVESGVFRIVDETLAAYVDRRPERVDLSLAWDADLVVEIAAVRPEPGPEEAPAPPPSQDLAPVLAAMIEDRRTEALPDPTRHALPESVWRDGEERAASLGIEAELLEDGHRLRLVVPLAALS